MTMQVSSLTGLEGSAGELHEQMMYDAAIIRNFSDCRVQDLAKVVVRINAGFPEVSNRLTVDKVCSDPPTIDFLSQVQLDVENRDNLSDERCVLPEEYVLKLYELDPKRSSADIALVRHHLYEGGFIDEIQYAEFLNFVLAGSDRTAV